MLRTLEEALLEAQGGDIDHAIGYSILKDIYNRQNFTVKSAKYTGKKKIQFIYTDPDYIRDPHKLQQLTVTFFVKKVTENEFKNIKDSEWIRKPETSFVSNRNGKIVGTMARKQGMPESIPGAEPRIKIHKEYIYRNKQSQYIYYCEFWDSKNGDFVDAYKIDIIAEK